MFKHAKHKFLTAENYGNTAYNNVKTTENNRLTKMMAKLLKNHVKTGKELS